MSDWREVVLGDACERVTVGHVGKMANEYVSDGVPYLRSKDVRPFVIDESKLLRISPEFHKKLAKSELRSGDVVVVRTGYPGTAAVIPEQLDGANCSDLVIITPARDLNAHLLAAIFNSSWGRAAVRGNLVGSAQQHFNVSSAKALRITVPSRPEQDRIADVLCSLNDLIENGRRRIRALERMVQEIYQEWFVRLRYPGYQRDELVDSSIRPLPAGWRVSTLAQDLPFQLAKPGVTPYEGSKPYIATADCSGVHEISVVNALPFDALPSRAQHRPIPNSVWFGRMAGYRKIMLYSASSAEVDAYTLSSGFACLECDADWFAYVAATVIDPEFEIVKARYATGATQVSLTDKGAKAMPLVLPADGIARLFRDAVEPHLELLPKLRGCVRTLESLRTQLLPKLVTGSIDVSKLDLGELLEESAG